GYTGYIGSESTFVFYQTSHRGKIEFGICIIGLISIFTFVYIKHKTRNIEAISRALIAAFAAFIFIAFIVEARLIAASVTTALFFAISAAITSNFTGRIARAIVVIIAIAFAFYIEISQIPYIRDIANGVIPPNLKENAEYIVENTELSPEVPPEIFSLYQDYAEGKVPSQAQDNAKLLLKAMPVIITFSCSTVAITILICNYVVWSYIRSRKNALISSLAINFTYFKGTTFYKADLTEADFTSATLEGADFREANLLRTRFWQNQFLDRIRPGLSYLRYPCIIQLFTNPAVYIEELKGLNLRGINLRDVNLKGVDLIGTDLSRADLQNVDLSEASLAQTFLDGADLTGANLTGATIGYGGIGNTEVSSTTKLAEIKCNFIYVDSGQSNRSDSNHSQSSRRPHNPNHDFKPGEFEALMLQARNAVDLIFADGIDWKAFFASFQKLRQQYDDNISIQAIEKKSSDAFIVRLEVPQEANKAAVEVSAKQLYETQLKALEAQYEQQLRLQGAHLEDAKKAVKSQRRDKATLMRIIETMADSQVKMEIGTVHGGVAGNVEGDMNIYTPEQQKSLAEAAQEIQQLLDQLSETYSLAEVPAQAEAEIKGNPQLKGKVVSALKGGGKKALQELVKHPAIAILIAAIEGWEKGK
ncbi:MAG: pentapeptide repeat-containing protein, partial [Cyanobacteria bacterium P01_A01_bin.123]